MEWSRRDIILLIIFIVLLIFIFSGCGSEHDRIKKSEHTVYTFEYDSCTYIGLGGYYMIHSETCKNPMHNCDCVDYKLEQLLDIQ